MWVPVESTSVEHQGLLSGSEIVVQLPKDTPLKMKGNTQIWFGRGPELYKSCQKSNEEWVGFGSSQAEIVITVVQ